MLLAYNMSSLYTYLMRTAAICAIGTVDTSEFQQQYISLISFSVDNTIGMENVAWWSVAVSPPEKSCICTAHNRSVSLYTFAETIHTPDGKVSDTSSYSCPTLTGILFLLAIL